MKLAPPILCRPSRPDLAKTGPSVSSTRNCATYLDAAVEAKMADGLPHHAAMRAARAEMGSVEAIKDHVRDVGWETHLDAFARDLRYGMRSLLRAPRFTVPSLLTLALGIGATAAMFSVLRCGPARAAAVSRARSRGGRVGNQPGRHRRNGIAPANFVVWRERARTLDHLGMVGPRRTRDHAQRPAAAGERPDRRPPTSFARWACNRRSAASTPPKRTAATTSSS